MNVDSAIKHLKKIGFKVVTEENYYSVHRGYHINNFTARELVDFASIYSSEYRRGSKLRECVKRDYRRNSRAFQRDRLAHGDFESLPSKDDKRAHSNFRIYD